MRLSYAVPFAAAFVGLTLPGAAKAVDPHQNKQAPTEKDPVECVLLFRFKNEEPAAADKARRNIAKALEEDAKAEYRKSDAQNAVVFLGNVKRLKDEYGNHGSPLQREILQALDRYVEAISEQRPGRAPRFKVRPSVNLLKSVERELNILVDVTPKEVKPESPWRTTFEQTRMTNILIAAVERKWGDEHFHQVDQILTDREAGRGLARLAGFYNRVRKELGTAGTEEKIGKALDAWVLAPEEVKRVLMGGPKLKEFLEDPVKYVAAYEARLAKEQGENGEKVRRFRDEKRMNEARLKAMGSGCVKLFPSCAAASE
jgi:hypothetical protein